MNPSGPHPVGVADLSATSPGPGVDRLAARIFYPCARGWTLPCTWIPHINYARGYVGYLFKMVTKQTWKTSLSRAAMTSAAWALGGSRVLPVYYNAQAAAVDAVSGLMPIVVFSHGLAGTRNAYSSICIELASQGYVVMALEHSDGSASVARLPRLHIAAAATAAAAAVGAVSSTTAHSGSTADAVAAAAAQAGPGAAAFASGPNDCRYAGGSGGVPGSEWCFYAGLGDKVEQLRKTRHRVAEVATAYRLLQGLHEGHTGGGNSSGGVQLQELPPAVAASLRGRLDLQRAAVAGHSYGGATAAAAAATLPCFKAAVSLDPWWDCIDDQWPVLWRWTNPHAAPLLVVGSDDWNTPTSEGKLKCGGANRERVLAAAAAGGGGSVLVVPRGSTHVNFDDVMLLFGKSLNALLRMIGMRTSLEPQMAHRINMWCITHFLAKHLPPPASGDTAPSAAAAARPLREGDLEPYKENVGEWAATLRLSEGSPT